MDKRYKKRNGGALGYGVRSCSTGPGRRVDFLGMGPRHVHTEVLVAPTTPLLQLTGCCLHNCTLYICRRLIAGSSRKILAPICPCIPRLHRSLIRQRFDIINGRLWVKERSRPRTAHHFDGSNVAKILIIKQDINTTNLTDHYILPRN
jgi:hypothetical protein